MNITPFCRDCQASHILNTPYLVSSTGAFMLAAGASLITRHISLAPGMRSQLFYCQFDNRPCNEKKVVFLCKLYGFRLRQRVPTNSGQACQLTR